MTRAFSPRKKYRILVNFGALIIVGDSITLLSQMAWRTESETKRFKLLRHLNCAVRCACGCDTWAPLRDIDFHHVKEHANGGLTEISNGAPLRRQPCHARFSAAHAAVTGKVTRTRRKLSVTTRRNDSLTEEVTRPRKPWPTRPLSNPKWKKCMDGTVERRG